MRILLFMASAFLLAGSAQAVTVIEGGRSAGLAGSARPAILSVADRAGFDPAPPVAGVAAGQPLVLHRSNIASLGAAIGTVTVGDVPDQAFWALLVAGFAVGGFALRGRRTTAVAA